MQGCHKSSICKETQNQQSTLKQGVPVYPYNEIRPAIRSNNVLIHAMSWMNLKNMISKRNQSQETMYCIIPLR